MAGGAQPRGRRVPSPGKKLGDRRAATFCGAAARAAHLRADRAARAGGEGRGRGGVMSGEGRGSVRRRERAAGRAPVPRLSREGGAAGRGERAAGGAPEPGARRSRNGSSVSHHGGGRRQRPG